MWKTVSSSEYGKACDGGTIIKMPVPIGGCAVGDISYMWTKGDYRKGESVKVVTRTLHPDTYQVWEPKIMPTSAYACVQGNGTILVTWSEGLKSRSHGFDPSKV